MVPNLGKLKFSFHEYLASAISVTFPKTLPQKNPATEKKDFIHRKTFKSRKWCLIAANTNAACVYVYVYDDIIFARPMLQEIIQIAG